MYYRNKTNTKQGYYDSSNNLIIISPNQVIHESQIPDTLRHVFEPVPPLYEFLCNNPSATLQIHRTFAMGDVIMIYTMCRWIKKRFPECNIIFTTQTLHGKILETNDKNSSGIRVKFCDKVLKNIDYYFNLDGWLENDHHFDEWAKYHRIVIGLKALGFPNDEIPLSGNEIPWGLNLGNDAYAFADGWFQKNIQKHDHGKLTVGIQIRGSGPTKSLKLDTVKYLAEKLSDFCDVILMDYSGPFYIKHPHVHHLYRIPIRKVGAIIQKCNAMITMDSGLLWIAHLVHTPTICILGPTPTYQRIGLFPDKSKVCAIRTEKRVNCEPCGENAKKCGNSFLCLNSIDPQYLFEEIKDKLEKIVLNGDIRFKFTKNTKIKDLKTSDFNTIGRLNYMTGGIKENLNKVISYSLANYLKPYFNKYLFETDSKIYDSKGNLFNIEFRGTNDIWVQIDNNKFALYDPDQYVPAYKYQDVQIMLKEQDINTLNQIEKDYKNMEINDEIFKELLYNQINESITKGQNVSGSF